MSDVISGRNLAGLDPTHETAHWPRHRHRQKAREGGGITLTHNIATRGITVDSSGDVWVSDPIVVSEGVAGLHASTAPWFKARDVAFLGGDGPQDVIPSLVEGVNLPVHTLIIGAMGVHIFDQMDLEAVAETAARLNRWDFMLTAAPYPIVGGTGYPLNAIATF